MDRQDIATRINHIHTLIHDAEKLFHRQPNSVQLLAVSKGQPVESIEQAWGAGVRDFGESYWQEAQIKIKHLSSRAIIWHFIGPIQSNKTAAIASHFSWVHSVSRLKIAQLLDSYRPSSLPPLNVCLQINFDSEASKSGVKFDEVEQLASEVVMLPNLRLRGLMMIPKPERDDELQYLSFIRLRDLQHRLNDKLGLSLDTLSMGMSEDMTAAIRAGSTMVRIGRAIFGERHED